MQLEQRVMEEETPNSKSLMLWSIMNLKKNGSPPSQGKLD
jgi:hypothetical protein